MKNTHFKNDIPYHHIFVILSSFLVAVIDIDTINTKRLTEIYFLIHPWDWTKGKEFKTLPQAQGTRGLSSYHKFKRKSSTNFIFRTSTKHHLLNLNQTSASRLNLNFKILTKHSFRVIATKNNLHNLNQGSAAKYWLNFSCKILTKCSSRISTKNNLHNRNRRSAAKYWLNCKILT